MSLILLIILAIIVIPIVLLVAMYNGLVQRRLRVEEAWSQIDVQLKRRHDLIPNLVNAVKGYMGYEQRVLESVTQARANAVAAGAQGPRAQAAAEGQLSTALRSLFAVAENYPDLKANQNVLSLQEQLTTAEDQISSAREAYNTSVRTYNTSIATFPAVLMVGMMGFHPREFFEAEPAAAEAPTVDLNLGA